MLARDLETFTMWLCLVVHVFAGVLRAPGMVLCVGAGNHFAIEVTHSDSRCGGCSEAEEDPTHGGGSPALGTAGKCPCVDIPLGTSANLSTIRARSESTTQILSALVAPVAETRPVVALPCPPADAACWRPPPLLGRSSLLSHLRVVILLI